MQIAAPTSRRTVLRFAAVASLGVLSVAGAAIPSAVHASPAAVADAAYGAVSKTPGNSSPDGQVAPPQQYLLPGDFRFPEGIAVRPGGDGFFTGSLVDGTVLIGDATSPAPEVLLTAGGDGRTSAVGMKVDTQDRLIIAGGATGVVFVYDSQSGRLLHRFSSGRTDGFLNDVALAPNGDVYVTDSFQPVVYRIPAAALSDVAVDQALEPFVSLVGTPIEYSSGFNLNGIVVSRDGRYLIVAQTNSAELFRINSAEHRRAGLVEPITLDGPAVAADGLALLGQRLYAVDKGDDTIVRIDLRANLTRGREGARVASPLLRSASTLAAQGSDLLVVNLQTDKLLAGLAPELPFDIVRLPRP